MLPFGPRAVAAAAVLVLCIPGVRATAQTLPTSAPIAQLLRDPGALVEWITTHSHAANAAAARVAQAQAALGATRLYPNPQVSVTLGGVPAGTTNPPGLGWVDTVNYGATVAQLFEIRKRAPRTEAARLRLDGEQQALSSTLVGTLADAREAIARVLYAKSRKTALAEELDTSKQVLDLQRVRLDRGDLSGVDFDRLQLDAQVLESDLAQASAELEESLTTCASLLFATCDTDAADLGAVVDQLQAPDVALPADWTTRIAERPDIQSLHADADAAGQDMRLALARRVPDPVVSASYTRDRFLVSGDNPRTFAFGVTIPFPAFDRGQRDAERAAAAERELRETEAAATSRANVDVDGLRRRQAAVGAALDGLQRDALVRANSILTSTADAVNQGELSTTDLLLARRARTDVTLKVMELQLQLFLVQNELSQVLGLDAPLVRRVQGATWPTP